jgi:hypothetical protein
MITIDYVLSDIEYLENGKVMLWLTRPFGPVEPEQAEGMKCGDEMSINIAFPTDIPPDAPIDESQMSLFNEESEDDGA